MPRKLLGVLSLIMLLSGSITGCGVVSSVTNIAGNDTATTDTISVGAFPGYGYAIYATLKPSQSAVAGRVYDVDLYEKGKFRATTTISFTQPQINVQVTQIAAFPASLDESNAYFMKDLSQIFSVKVHEPITTTSPTQSATSKTVLINPNQQAILTITSPKGGEVWKVGRTVNITWAST